MLIERTIAICIFLNRGRILAAPGFDDVAGQRFYRPLGGQIEPGETPTDAVVREMREETGLAVSGLNSLGALDNRFVYRCQPHLELVYVLDGCFDDRSIYELEAVPIREDVWEGPAVWLSLAALPDEPIYPDGLLSLLGAAG